MKSADPERVSLNPSIFVLADDLTGAADSAVRFGGDQRVRVTFPPQEPWSSNLEPETVQVFDSETRDCSADVAAARVADACTVLPATARSAGLLYKKVDSTLRGPVGAELQAVITALGRRAALLAPSFPANDRIVYDGVLYIDGRPLATSAAAADPVNPMRSSRIADLLQSSSGLPVTELSLDVVRGSTASLAGRIAQASAHGGVLVADAETDDDLHRLARAAAVDQSILPAGSAGLAGALAAEWLPPSARSIRLEPPACDRILVVIGSANPRSHDQLRVLSATLPVRTVTLSPVALADPATRPRELERALLETETFHEGVLALTLGAERASGDSRMLVTNLAQAARAALFNSAAADQRRMAAVLTGGDTTLAFCRAVGIRAIWPRGEIAPGVPWSDGELDGLAITLITKAGGFGQPAILLQAIQSLTRPHVAAA